MKLIDWQKQTNTPNIKLAAILDVDTSYITHINKGNRRPSPELALKIQQATNGAVTVMELLYPGRC